MSRPLNKIAAEVLADWGPPQSGQPAYRVFCRPYLEAMLSLTSIADTYGLDPADDIVVRFLVNAGPYRGTIATRVKVELNQLLKEYNASSARQ